MQKLRVQVSLTITKNISHEIKMKEKKKVEVLFYYNNFFFIISGNVAQRQ